MGDSPQQEVSMSKQAWTKRRTVLRTLGAGVVGGVGMTGTALARRGRGRGDSSFTGTDRGRGRGPRNVVEIEAKHPDNPDDDDHYIFELSADVIEAGWTDFILDNQSGSTHFAGMYRYTDDAVDALEARVADDPEVDTLREAHLAEVALPFQEAWNPYWDEQTNMLEFFDDLFEKVAPWFLAGGAIPVGGPGLTQGHHTARTVMELEPGLHFIECYILDEDGVYHTTHGMVELFEVTEPTSNAREPTADVDVSISSTEGLELVDSIGRPGRYRIGVTFEDNAMYSHGLGHDVHLIRLDDGVDIDEVAAWMNYLDPGADLMYRKEGALVSTSANPGPGTWLGGVQDILPLDGSQTAYVDVSLSPGDYALVAEVPHPENAQPVDPVTFEPIGEPVSMLETFTVNPRTRR